jgi:perosamine synthetase
MEIREKTLPVLRPFGGKEEIEALSEVILSGWWGKGPKVAEFEDKFSKLVGSKYAVAVTSNTHGMDLVIKALGIKNKDIINPTISFLTTAVVPLWNNCSSNIVDVEKGSLCIDPLDVEKNIKKDTECIIAVNMAGVPAKIDEIRKFYKGFIIEDCAHSCYTQGAGTKGDVAIWSFQAVKTLPISDGGMITTNDENLYNKLKNMTWLGISSTFDRVSKSAAKPGYAWDYQVDILGYKCYMVDLVAAIGLEQLKKLPKHLEFRRHIESEYNKRLNPIIERPEWTETVQYYCSRVPKEHRDTLISYLADKKIHTSVHFKPLHKYNIVKQDREYLVADNEWLKLISLPVHNAMIEEDIDYVIYWVNKYFEDKV